MGAGSIMLQRAEAMAATGVDRVMVPHAKVRRFQKMLSVSCDEPHRQAENMSPPATTAATTTVESEHEHIVEKSFQIVDAAA